MLLHNERALATIRTVAEIQPIPDADKIVAARVDGWWVVIRKGESQVGDLVVYIEIDSWVPHTVAPFLSKGKHPKSYGGIEGERLKTIRLRKQLSQGLLLPLDALDATVVPLVQGTDVTEALGITKWERTVPANQVGVTKGSFPQFLRKTDQERIQNVPEVLDDLDRVWEVSLKLDGSSTTIFCNGGEPGVCSRNMNLKLSNKDGRFVKAANDAGLIQDLQDIFEYTGQSYAIQGELMGPGIQGNRETFLLPSIWVFDIWDIDNQRYLDPLERSCFVDHLRFGGSDIDTVPAMSLFGSLYDLGVSDMQSLLELPEALGSLCFTEWCQPIEGVVLKALDGKQTFKVINNKFLEREK